MDDLIWRSDAIDALGERPLAWTQDEYLRGLQTQYDSDVEAIQNVLPAQQWTPCSERLPEENNFYLATIYSKELQTAFCDILFYGAPQLCEDRKVGWYFMHNGEMEQVFNIIAWMLLPQPWKEITYQYFEEAEWVNDKCSMCDKGIEDLIDSREWYENEKPNYCPFCGKKFKRSEDKE